MIRAYVLLHLLTIPYTIVCCDGHNFIDDHNFSKKIVSTPSQKLLTVHFKQNEPKKLYRGIKVENLSSKEILVRVIATGTTQKEAIETPLEIATDWQSIKPKKDCHLFFPFEDESISEYTKHISSTLFIKRSLKEPFEELTISNPFEKDQKISIRLRADRLCRVQPLMKCLAES